MSDFLKTPFRRPAPILSWHWLFALCLLVVNDHLLKGSGHLPGWLTGKLSDFAGLYVAPLVVATLCGVRRRFPWWLCHLLVGVGFSAIQLSEPFARIVETATQLLGIQCRIWSDPTDLIALPVLLLSVFALAPKPKRAFRGSAPARSNGWTRGAEHLVLALGALACVASSDPGNREFNTSSPALRNESDAPVEVRILPLRSDLVLNCDELARDPGALFSAEAFGPAVRFSLAPNQNVPVEQRNQMGTSELCDAALLDVDGGRQHLVFWDT